MTAASRAIDRGRQIGERALQSLGREFETGRRGLGSSQEHVAAAARVSRPGYSKVERGKCQTLQVVEVARVAAVLGLDPSFRLYPSGPPLRDAASARRLREFLSLAAPPLITRTEVPLPALDDHTNRRILAEFDGLFVDLARLRPANVKAALAAGQPPGTGIVLV
jgi:transcriptional regulator with XRE-family HTH domain